MTAETPVIRFRTLQKSFGGPEALGGVDLVAPRGQVLSPIGSSGSGKSTLSRCCNPPEDCWDGDVLFKGAPVKRNGTGPGRHPADRAQVIIIRTSLSMVFRQLNLWAHMTILPKVMETPVTVRGQSTAKARARALRDKVGIGDRADAWPMMLSGGQRQRAAIAGTPRAVPRALLSDEAAPAQDPEPEQAVVRVIKAPADGGAR